MSSGRTVWDELALHYQHGVETVRWMQDTLASLEGKIDSRRYEETRSFLAIQEKEAVWWKDACLTYFQTFSKRLLPPGVEPPRHPLEYYMRIKKRYVPG